MKKYLLTFLLPVLCLSWMTAQESAKMTRRIYLWDVTLSMKGYQGKTPDIYDDVVRYLERCINEVKDESTEIYVLPFQDHVLATWKAYATVDGKEYLINQIRKYNNNDTTSTNISGPIEYVKKNIIKSDNRYTFFALLTDGRQSPKFGGRLALFNELKSWDRYALEKHSYLLYVMLTPEAEDPVVTHALDTMSQGESVHPNDSQLDVLDLMSKSQVKVNLMDDKYITVPFSNNGSATIPTGIKVRYTTIDAPDGINLVGEATIENGAIQIDADYGMPTDSLKLTLPDVSAFTLKMEIINKDEIKNKDKKIVLLTNSVTQIELINKPERALRISVKK